MDTSNFNFVFLGQSVLKYQVPLDVYNTINHIYETKYPELKGKDPQKRAWKNIASYSKIGSVVHKVVPEVDAGEVIVEKSTRTRDVLNIDRAYNVLRTTSFNAWIEFLKEHL